MYDFSNFIDILNNFENKMVAVNNAIDLIKSDFHIGRIEAKSIDFLDCKAYTADENYDDKIIASYTNNGYNFNFYKKKDDYVFKNSELKDINLLLIRLGLYYSNFILNKKAEEAGDISANTKLPNTHGYMKKVSQLINCVDATTYNTYFINIKALSLVNKVFGGDQGDRAILGYANKIRAFATKDEVVGHLGGDNFVAFIKRERHNSFINLVTMCPVELEKDNIKKTVNLIGVVGYNQIKTKNPNYDIIMSCPSLACQYARGTKKIVVELTPDLIDTINSVKNIEGTFNEDLENGSFVVYYQPKFDIKSGKILGVEALSRWINNGKVVPPGIFVPILERNGEIVKLDLYVLENLCKDIHNYRNQGHNIVPASCNLSRRDFEIKDIEQKVIDIIKKYNVRTEDIVIEVTETTNLEENERLAKFISVMHDNGIMTSIDDFGTGYSSLSVLRDFKVSEIKIDRSFINRKIFTDSDEIIIGSIIDMAKRLNINVICEGVETKSQADFLISLGCNNAQGFLYSKPVPKEEFEAMLQRIGTIYD